MENENEIKDEKSLLIHKHEEDMQPRLSIVSMSQPTLKTNEEVTNYLIKSESTIYIFYFRVNKRR